MKSFLKGFVYAGKGIYYCLAKERNMRVHLCFTVYMFAFLTVYDFFEISKTEFGILLALCALVMSLECVNTAIERTVNLITKEKNPVAGAAKDAAAGAVLIAAIFAVIAGIVIMYQPEAFKKMYEYYASHIGIFIVLIISVVLSLMFIFLPAKKNNGGQEGDSND
jgi:diacylglycerol kinase